MRSSMRGAGRVRQQAEVALWRCAAGGKVRRQAGEQIQQAVAGERGAVQVARGSQNGESR